MINPQLNSCMSRYDHGFLKYIIFYWLYPLYSVGILREKNDAFRFLLLFVWTFIDLEIRSFMATINVFGAAIYIPGWQRIGVFCLSHVTVYLFFFLREFCSCAFWAELLVNSKSELKLGHSLMSHGRAESGNKYWVFYKHLLEHCL